jgi:hypothetical protein
MHGQNHIKINNLLLQMYMESYEKYHILMKLEFSRQIFEESTIVRFHEMRSLVGSRSIRTDGPDEADSSFRISSNASKDAEMTFP